jgi:triosephosphate isomerase
LKIIGCNWKMNGSLDLLQKIAHITQKPYDDKNFEVIILPSYPFLSGFYRDFPKYVKLGAQDFYKQKNGAFTGEVSLEILKNLSCEYVLVGHSERRIHFQENNQTINAKLKNCLEEKIKPILCIGESIDHYQSGQTKNFLEQQVTQNLADIEDAQIVIAYEPIWSIGTGVTPSINEIQNIYDFLKDIAPANSKIIYGGSVNSSNFKDFIQIADGVLMGGSSIDIAEITKIYSSLQ